MEAGLTLDARLIAAVEARASDLETLLRDLVRAPSLNPPGDTRAAAAIALDYLASSAVPAQALGAADDRPSVIAASRGDRHRLLFLSHLDTVPLGSRDAWEVDPFAGHTSDGRLYGRGAADAKGSAAAMLLALRVLAAEAPDVAAEVAVALVADEETGGQGAQHLLDRGLLAADAVVVGETTDNQVAIAEKGVAWFRLSTRGRTAHASVPYAGVNAAAHLVRWLERLDRRLVPELARRRHPLLSPPTLSIGTLAGGVAPNVVPDHAEAVVDRRTLPRETVDFAREEILAQAAAVGMEGREARASVDTLIAAEPFETPAEATVVQAALAARRALGLAASPVGYQQASDGRFFGARGIPTIVLGPGVAEGTHVPNESVPLAQVLETAKLHALAAYRVVRALDATPLP
jgi:acetylornithine deacetylase/succinyl-diaminopimelate desuccinylase family protein